MFFKRNEKKEQEKPKVKIDKKEYWLLVKAAYKAILPLVLVIIVVYFIFTLVLTKFVIK